ncbi:MAG: DNA polymerase I [Actinobacteria bacterium]|nr:DNA polymerase I [Actinomycetota bacterium]
MTGVSSVPEAFSRKIYLLDGNSLAYRAFFALPDTFVDAKGAPTNALFGLANMFLKIVGDEEHGNPAVVAVWDAGLSGREEVYEPYKAQRDAKPDALREQWPHFYPMAQAFGFENVRVDGWEADDVIASLAEKAKGEGHEVIVVTGDRDSFQLVDDGKVTIMATGRGVTDTKLYDEAAVIERYGVPPALVPDFIGLKGDTSDNIPGVPGIGEKTAAQLLQEFGSLEDVLSSVDKISGAKRKQNLTEHAELARISKQLATMNRRIDVPGFSFDDLFTRQVDPAALRDCLREHDLREPLRRAERLFQREAFAEIESGLDAAVEEAEAARAGGRDARPAPDRLALKHVQPSALADLPDAEITLLLRPAAAGIDGPADSLLADAANQAAGEQTRFAAIAAADVLVGLAGTVAEVIGAIGARPVVTHHLKEQLNDSDAAVPALAHDTRIAAYLIDSARRQYAIREMAVELGVKLAAAEDEAVEPQLRELAVDAQAVAGIAAAQRPSIAELGLTDVYESVELPLVAVLVEIERNGLKLDTDALTRAAAGFEGEIATLESDIYDLAGERFTIGSPKQLAPILFDKLELSRGRKGKTGYSTDARVLASLRGEHPIVEKIERWRELTKLKSTYVDALPKMVSPRDGRIHTTLDQTRAATGRLSSTNPNLQNIPVRTPLGATIRECFVAEPGNVLTSADYSQVELRVLAQVAGDETLREIFRRGEDVHTETAAAIFGIDPAEVDHATRDRAKAVNFGIIYGLSAFGLSDRLRIPQKEASEFIKRYLDRFAGVRKFMDEVVDQAKRDGYVTTLLGRRRAIPELNSSQMQTRRLGERLAVNTVVQGTAADIIKIAMIKCSDALRESDLETRLVMQIHDELLFEGPVGEAAAIAELAEREMANAYPLDPPLGVSVGSGPNWLAAK